MKNVVGDLAFENFDNSPLSAPSVLWRVSYFDCRLNEQRVRSVNWYDDEEEAKSVFDRKKELDTVKNLVIQEFREDMFGKLQTAKDFAWWILVPLLLSILSYCCGVMS